MSAGTVAASVALGSSVTPAVVAMVTTAAPPTMLRKNPRRFMAFMISLRCFPPIEFNQESNRASRLKFPRKNAGIEHVACRDRQQSAAGRVWAANPRSQRSHALHCKITALTDFKIAFNHRTTGEWVIDLGQGCSSLTRVERARDVARQFARRDQHGVEPHVARHVVRMLRQPGLGRGDDALLVAVGDRLRRRRRACCAPSPRRTPACCGGRRRCRSRRPACGSAAPGCDSPWRSGRRRRGSPPRGRCGTPPRVRAAARGLTVPLGRRAIVAPPPLSASARW